MDIAIGSYELERDGMQAPRNNMGSHGYRVRRVHADRYARRYVSQPAKAVVIINHFYLRWAEVGLPYNEPATLSEA